MHYLFEVTAKPGYTIEQYAEAWVRASELIQQAPGGAGHAAASARLATSAPRLAIATWESKAARDASPASLPGAVQEIIESQAPFVEIRFIGEFEAPEWEVLPPDWPVAAMLTQ